MKTNVESLKTLYTKLGGQLTDTYPNIAGGIPVGEYDLISDCILACSEKSSGGGGGSLPEPGAVGNVLTSTGTAWESAAPQGGELAFTLILGEDSVACDVAVTDIVAALDSKRPVFGTAGELGELIVKSWNTELNKVVLYLYIPEDTVLSVIEFVGTSGTPDTWEYSEPKVVDGLQSVSPADNGKVLGVDNGAYTLVAPALNIGGTMSGSDFTIDNVSPAQINAAYTAHRPVYMDLPAMHARVYLQVCEYTDDTSYKFVFNNTQITSDGIVVIQATFVNDPSDPKPTFTGEVDSKTAAAT